MAVNKRLFSHLAILGANIIYGTNYNIAKPIMPDFVQPLGLVVLRVLGALSLFWFAGLFVHEKIARRDFIRLALCGLFGVALNQMMFLSGLSLTTPIDASIIMVSNPILVLIAATLIIKERITPWKILGIALGASGALLIITQSGSFSFEGDHFIGNLLILLNAASYGIYLVLVKSLMSKYHPFTVMKWVFLFGSFIIFPAGISQAQSVSWAAMPTNIVWSVVFVVFATTFLAYLLNIFAMKNVSPTTVSIYIYSQPLIASTVSILTGQDSLTPIKIVAGILIFSGVYFVSVFKSTKTQVKR